MMSGNYGSLRYPFIRKFILYLIQLQIMNEIIFTPPVLANEVNIF